MELKKQVSGYDGTYLYGMNDKRGQLSLFDQWPR